MKKGLAAHKIIGLLLIVLCALLLGVGAEPGNTASKLVIHVNKGIGKATLGMSESQAVKAIGTKPSRSGKDTEYEGRLVYYKMYGKANAGGEYPLEMYSNKKRKVFMFVFNSTAYPTDEGTKVGSSEESLKQAYGSKLKSKSGRIYTHYWLGDKTGTDFYVKDGKVSQIIVRSY